MTYRNILVHVDNSTAAMTRIAAASRLASRFGSALTGVFLGSELYPRYAAADVLGTVAEALERAIEEQVAEREKASSAARAMFTDHVRDSGIPFHWLNINGDSDAPLIHCARRHDLAILPPEMEPTFSGRALSAAQIGMGAGGPILILKHGGYPLDFGKKILVAWNGSREAARSVRDALPFLSRADEIHFLTVSGDAGGELDELMQRHLHSNGCKYGKLVVERNVDTPVAELIRLHVGETGADMVVLGLYGHSRLQELVLGGVSRDLMKDPPMPMLVSH